MRRTISDLICIGEPLVEEGDQIPGRETGTEPHAVTGQRVTGTVSPLVILREGQDVGDWGAGWDGLPPDGLILR